MHRQSAGTDSRRAERPARAANFGHRPIWRQRRNSGLHAGWPTQPSSPSIFGGTSKVVRSFPNPGRPFFTLVSFALIIYLRICGVTQNGRQGAQTGTLADGAPALAAGASSCRVRDYRACCRDARNPSTARLTGYTAISCRLRHSCLERRRLGRWGETIPLRGARLRLQA